MTETLVLAYGFIYNKCIKNSEQLLLCRTSDGLPYYAAYIVELSKKILKIIDEDKEEDIVEFIEKINKDAIKNHLDKMKYAQKIGKGRGVSIGWQFVYKSSEGYLFSDDFPEDNGCLFDIADDNISAIQFLQLLKSISEEKNISINDLLQILGLQHKISITNKEIETHKPIEVELVKPITKQEKPKKKTKKEIVVEEQDKSVEVEAVKPITKQEKPKKKTKKE